MYTVLYWLLTAGMVYFGLKAVWHFFLFLVALTRPKEKTSLWILGVLGDPNHPNHEAYAKLYPKDHPAWREAAKLARRYN